MKKKCNGLLLPVVLVLLLGFSACISGQGKTTPSGESNTSASNQPGSDSSGEQGTPAASISPSKTPTADVSETKNGDVTNGEQIYFRAIDQQGNSISYTGGPPFGGMMMGAYLTCASCHGPEAQGGKHVMMHMQVMDAPPVYYDGLVMMAQKDAGKSTYTLEDFRKAVIQGRDIDGSTLSQDMPRWQMSDQDLMDLFAFLKTIH